MAVLGPGGVALVRLDLEGTGPGAVAAAGSNIASAPGTLGNSKISMLCSMVGGQELPCQTATLE